MKKHISKLLAVCCLMAAFSLPASALEYTFDAPDAGLFGYPTSVEVISVPMGKRQYGRCNRHSFHWKCL